MKFRPFLLLILFNTIVVVLTTKNVIAQATVEPQTTPLPAKPTNMAVNATVTVQASPTPTLLPDPQYTETFMGRALCAPGVYLITPTDCLLLGPAKVLTDLARKGLSLPLKPLAAAKPDVALTQLDKKYAKLNLAYGQQATFYPNPQSGEQGVGFMRKMPPGQLQYLSYKIAANLNGHYYVQVESNEWVRASPIKYSNFQGLTFTRQPGNNFGWIVDAVNPATSPSMRARTLPEKLVRETVVQVYDQVEAEGTTWYMIGIGRWVSRQFMRVVDVDAAPPPGVDNNRWIEVNLYEQTVTAHENGKLVFASLAATGVEPYYTQPGLFKITTKKDFETMSGAFETGKVDYYFLENVPWTMYFDQKRALHGAYWRAMFGYPQSHGCVNMSVGDARWLYDWAKVGDWVFVWDPSGKTPTDAKFYGAGGA